MNLKARKIQDGELGKLMELYKYLHPEETCDISESITAAWQEMIRNDSHFTCFVIELDGRFVASCAAAIIPNLTRKGRPYALIENVITLPTQRRRGFGLAVIRAAVEMARERGCYKVMLLSGANRSEAHIFYEKAGFDRHRKTGFHMDLMS